MIVPAAQLKKEQIRKSGFASIIKDAYRAQAMAEAEEMRAKGYTYQQETARMVGMEAMQNGLSGNGEGGSSAGSMLGDLAGLNFQL